MPLGAHIIFAGSAVLCNFYIPLDSDLLDGDPSLDDDGVTNGDGDPGLDDDGVTNGDGDPGLDDDAVTKEDGDPGLDHDGVTQGDVDLEPQGVETALSKNRERKKH